VVFGSTSRTLLACLALAAVLAGCSPSDKEEAYLARRALLTRQNQGIRELIGEAERGTIVPTDQFLLGIHEKIIADLLGAGLPLERPVGKHFIVRLESAKVRFTDKYGLIIVDGVLFRPSTPDRLTQLRVYGGLGKVEIDPKTGKLNIRIAVDDIDLLQAGILDKVLGKGGKKLLETKGRDILQDALPPIEVPVTLAQDIKIPAIAEGAVQMDSLQIPLDLKVTRVIAAGHKLWVTFDAKLGDITGAEEGLGVSVGKKNKKGKGK
jgi:hypothetical protein